MMQMAYQWQKPGLLALLALGMAGLSFSLSKTK